MAVVVLDGADSRVINRLQEKNEIPHISEMEEDGVSTTLLTPSAFSPISWNKMGTGLSKENMSLNRTWSYETERGKKRLDANAISHRRFWSYLNAEGMETGIYHWLLTWPVEEVDGFMISGVMTGNPDSMSHPEELNISDSTVKDSLRSFKSFEIANQVLDEYRDMEVMVFGFTIPDKVQHHFWKFLDNDTEETQKYRDVIYRSYEETDELVERLRPEYTVILVSDHGFHRVKYITYEARINRLLQKIDLVDFRNRPEVHLANNWNFDKNSPIIQRLSKNRVLNRTHYRVKFEWMNRSVPREEIVAKLSDIKVSDGQNFLQDIRYEDGYFVAKMYLDPERMNPPFYKEQYTNLVYARGQIPTHARSMNVSYRGEIYKVWLGPEKSGDHTPGTDGIFKAAGEPFKDSVDEESLDIRAEDVAPLILYLKGVPVPEDMDGEVPKEIIRDSYLENHPVRYSDAPIKKLEYEREANKTEEQSNRVEERLSRLGYLN